uniref:Wsv216-like protein n=1 Tax=Marsupenaeus japonicus endogenous nimavirus TaxID=2133793 RepID=A0A401IP74_9VIRU|nr:wsv216-like protein [Marsupenaeus japonicus endogenous nimavirus]
MKVDSTFSFILIWLLAILLIALLLVFLLYIISSNYKHSKNTTTTVSVYSDDNVISNKYSIKDDNVQNMNTLTREVESSQLDDFIDQEIECIVKDIENEKHANYIASKIRERINHDVNDYNVDDKNKNIEYDNNNNNNTSSSVITLLSIKQIHIRLSEKGENKEIVSLSALYLTRANISQGRLPVEVRITFYRKNDKERPLGYMDTTIRSLGRPIILKEISRCLIYGEIYRVCIKSKQAIFYDDFVYIHSPFPEMVPILICQDAILLKCNKNQTASLYETVKYSPDLFSFKYLNNFPNLLPNLGIKANQFSNLEPIPGKTSGHCLLYAEDPIHFDGSLAFSDKSDGIVDAELTLIKNLSNPIEYYILLKRLSVINHSSSNIKGWIINHRSKDGAEYKQIFSVTACIEKYYSDSKIEIRPRERLRDLTIENSVTVWNTDEKIGIETGINDALFANRKVNDIAIPKDASFFQRNPYIVLDKETGECVMVTLHFFDHVPLNPRWALNPCHFNSRNHLLVINPQRKNHLSPYVSNVLIYKGEPGGASFTSQQGESHCSSVIVDRGKDLPSLSLPMVSLPGKQTFCVHIQHNEPRNDNICYSLIEKFPRSLPLETPLDNSSKYICKIYTRIPSLEIATKLTTNKTYANIGPNDITGLNNPYSDLANIIGGADKEIKTCTVFAIGFMESDGSIISDTIVQAIRSSLPNIVSVTDTNGVEVVRSKDLIVNNTSVLILFKNIYIDGSSQRWISSTPFGLGPCKTSGRCGILGNWVPLYTVDHVLKICKVFPYRYADNVSAKGFTVYLSNTCTFGRSVSASNISEVIALYLSPEIQGKRIVLNAITVRCNTAQDDDDQLKKTKIFSIPSKESIGGEAEGATSIIILDRVIYALMAMVTTNIIREKQHFARYGLFTSGSATLSEQFVKKHRNIMN